MDSETDRHGRQPPAPLRLAAACLIGGLLVGAGLSFGSWFTLQRVIEEAPSDYELVIPAGTAALVAQGAAPPTIPSSIRIERGGSLVVRNFDGVTHQIGEQAIAPGEARQVPLPVEATAGRDRSGTFVCSFHPGSAIELSLTRAPAATANLIPTFAIGLPLALVGFVVLRVTSRLD